MFGTLNTYNWACVLKDLTENVAFVFSLQDPDPDPDPSLHNQQ